MAKENITVSEMTKEEFVRLTEELDHLKTVERTEIAEKIRVARGHGDLSENSEYDEAKNDQARMEARIARLEEQLKNVRIVETSTDSVTLGTKVVLLDTEFNEEAEYRIASTVAANESGNVITADSPVGMAIMGHTVGEVVDVDAPGGSYQMKIIKISK